MGEKALVANIKLNQNLAFWDEEGGILKELKKSFKESKLKIFLTYENDNSVAGLIFF